MSKINKVVVKGVSYDIEDAQAREYIESMVTEVTWGQSNHIDDYIKAGVYDITGTRESTSDGLPITNMGENATIAAKLFVTVTPEGATTYRHSVGQTLILSNAEGKETKMYTRNGNRTSADGGVTYTVTWGAWATLQTNINVETVDNLDNLKDNGIYSGVWTKGSYNAYPLTFVCIVINDYIVGIAPRRISQFVYGLSKLNGTVVYQTRVWDDSNNAWGGWEILNQKEISSMISNEIKKVTDGVDPEKLDSLKDLITWVDTHGGEVAGIKNDIQANEVAIEAETERAIEAEKKLEEKIAKEKTALVNGDTIVGQAREVYSRTGKVDSTTFLKRTTAGGTSISDGVASVKQIGGNIVKNLIDGNFENVIVSNGTATNKHGVCLLTSLSTSSYCALVYKNVTEFTGHIYYTLITCLNTNAGSVRLSLDGGFTDTVVTNRMQWINISRLSVKNENSSTVSVRAYPEDQTLPQVFFKKWCVIDLTEMFGAGNEPTKDECDRMFGAMDALPQGLTVAQPTGLKSIGYNQWNPANVLNNKSIVENAIEDDVADRHIAIVECLPCKTGTGENNGYVIGYGEGDTWSDENVEVYLSPLNPLEVEGELYMHKLEKDSTYGTYVPQIKGYLLVVTPTTDKLCAHFHWSGDRAKTDYEEYIESNVSLPTIPEMSEWGLAGISNVNGLFTRDIIDLEKMIYTKRIMRVDDLSKISWYKGTDSLFYSEVIPSAATATSAIYSDAPYQVGFGAEGYMIIPTEGRLYLWDSTISTVAELKTKMAGKVMYVALATSEEYPIVTKAAPNYIGSDYGVEEFTGSKIPLAANILFYMRSLVGETRNFIDQLYTNTQKTDAKEVANYITNGIEENKQLATKAPNLALRALYIAAGAEYNDSGADKTKTAPWGETVTHKAGHYYLNGLGDITETQMRYIYNRGHFNDKDVSPLGYSATGRVNAIRTNLPRVGMWNASLQSYLCVSNKIIEVVNLHTIRGTETDICAINFANTEFIFADSSKLSVVDVRCLLSGNWLSNSFKNCSSLQEVRVRYLKNDIIFAQSPLLSKATVLYMIQNATPTSAITMTLHPDAYARLAEDADIVAALEAQPLVTLVSA